MAAETGWKPDPFERFELRYFDGARWTEHVVTGSTQSTDAPVPGRAPTPPSEWPTLDDAATPPAPPPPSRRRSNRILKQVRRARAHHGDDAGGSLNTARVLVVNQRARLTADTREYAIHDRDGRRLGTLAEVPRGVQERMSDRRRGLGDKRRAYDFVVRDLDDRNLLRLQRPESSRWGRAPLIVEGPSGVIGRIVKESRLRGAVSAAISGDGSEPPLGLKELRSNGVSGGLNAVSRRLTSAAQQLDPTAGVRFVLQVDGREVGSIQGSGRRAWDFAVTDADGHRIASITKVWAGWAKERLAKADDYVIDMTTVLEDPLRSLVIAAAVVVDFEMKRQ